MRGTSLWGSRSRRRARTVSPSPRAGPPPSRGSSARAARRPSTGARSRRRRETRGSETRPTWARTAIRRRRGPCRPTSPPSADRGASAGGSQVFLERNSASRLEQRLPEIAQGFDPAGDVVDPEVLDLDALLNFIRRHGRGHRGFGSRPYRVDRRERASPRVLVVVDEHVLRRALRHAVFRRDQLRRVRCKTQGEVLRERPDFLLQRSAPNRNIDVDSLRARRFRVGGHTEAFETASHEQRGFPDLRERGSGRRIEIEMQIVGAIVVVAPRVPGVQIDATQVHHPQERRKVLDDGKIDGVSGPVENATGLDPVRAGRLRALHEEEVPVCAVRIALHHHRAIREVREERGSHARVVLKKVALREFQLGPEELVEIGETDDLAVEIDLNVADTRGDRDRRRRFLFRRCRSSGRLRRRRSLRALLRGRSRRAHRIGSSLGGLRPWRTAPAIGTYASSRAASTQRSMSPPRLMSPRPTKSEGKRRRPSSRLSITSTYFPVAMLPSRITVSSPESAEASVAESRSRGSRNFGSPAVTPISAISRRSSSPTIVSGGTSPRPGVITRTPWGIARVRVKARPYASLPRK